MSKRPNTRQELVTARDIELLHLALEGEDRRQLEGSLPDGPTVHEAAAKLTSPQRAALQERFSKRMILHTLRAFLAPSQDAELLG